VAATLAVLAVVMSMAVREIGAWAASAELADRAHAMLLHLVLTRSEAVRRNTRVAACKSADGETCATDGGWEQGLIIFHDVNNSAQREPGEEVLRREGALPPGFVLTGNQSVSDYVSYGPTGQTRMESGAFQAGTLTLCRRSANPAEARQVVINAGGRPRTQRATVPACG
jgi:type IV fimbrial biogenesis protein FimT